MLTGDIDTAILSVRLSVCHVPVLYQNGLTCRRTFFSTWSHVANKHDDDDGFPSTKHLWKISTGSHSTGVLNRANVFEFRDFRPISGYYTIHDGRQVMQIYGKKTTK